METNEKKMVYLPIGDMPAEEFRRYGHDLIDWIADYLENIETYPVLPDIKPGDIKRLLPKVPPQHGEDMDAIINDLNKVIVPGLTHWNHPKFTAYFNSSSSGPGILGELLAAAFNSNAMLWKTNPASTELEQVTLGWLRQMLGLSEDFWGIIYDTASVASMHAIAAAREQLSDLQFREKGMTGRKELPKLRLYASEQAHSSIDKSAITLGIGLEGLRKIPVDSEFRMIPEELEKAIKEDRKNGWLPFCVVATVGTTSTTSIDPVDKIADICERESAKGSLWLHVDGAHGAAAALVPEMKWILKGTERADSFLINPHKWLFTPVDISAFYTKKPEILKRAFSLVADYLKTSESSEENFMNYGIQLGRRFRSLKFWFVLRYFGIEGMVNRVREHLRLGKLFTEWVDKDPQIERMAPVPMSTICFRIHPQNIKDEAELDKLNQKFYDEINSTGEMFISHTKLNEKYVLRVNFSSLRVEERHIREVWELLQRKMKELL
jgi:aromatic-L-amino-acid decarboxylase